ncbi:AraC family ligand binding domain-containing protein [Priestia aryabhattai]|uniref:AraC family ligand binding domain-containing protein n=1 Tax=Priestia aryabhattai TaxID=412384 RepID=UPI001ADBE562|nr:AraC family transcriptional regulator [Priestia aryabhattai]QTL47791.1 AraC family transcriptional regulator [Priestia aryabhattai]
MTKEIRTAHVDAALHIEAYRFKEIMQKFPAHFHEYYVIGFIEEGQRHLICQGKEYIINPGDLLLFNPYDTHSCEQIDGKTLDYRCINVTPDVMKKAVFDINGSESLPRFNSNVVQASEVVSSLKELHLQILNGEHEFKKEELFLYLLEELMHDHSNLSSFSSAADTSDEIKTICSYLEENYKKKITLDELSQLIGWSKYRLLRSFIKQKGISPYSYLETIRINQAKKLLEQGKKPIDVSFLTGFSDQSHLTKFFKSQVGLTPKQYIKIFENEKKTGC